MLLNILLGLLIIVGVALTGLVLLQRSEGGALGIGGGGGQLVSARGAANFLTRATWWFGTAFFILSLAITILLGRSAGSSAIDDLKIQSVDPAKMAADRQAFEAREKARIEAEKGGAGFTAPAPTIGAAPFAPPPAQPAPSPFAPAPAAPAAPAPATK